MIKKYCDSCRKIDQDVKIIYHLDVSSVDCIGDNGLIDGRYKGLNNKYFREGIDLCEICFGKIFFPDFKSDQLTTK